MKRLRRLFGAGLVLALVGTITPAASGRLSSVAPSVGTPGWGTGTQRGPVKCTPADVTPDGRVFPEPQVSATFLTFTDFQCGIGVLEQLNEDRIDVEILGRSASDHPIYNVKVTNERIPESEKRHLFILNSIHGNEPAGREGAARVIEDMVDARFMATEPFIKETMNRFVVHFTFGNPDGWVNGDFHGHNDAGFTHTRTNNGTPARDLNRNFPVQGFLRSANGTLDQTEGQGINELFLRHADTEHDVDDPENRGWYLGTDNHGQGAKPVAASGLQIVGQFDYQKSERLAHFADGIEGAMAEYGVLDVLQQLNGLTDGAVRPYEWGTLYDILGYSASGSGIDYYNTPGVVDGTGFATEMTASNAPYNFASHPHLLNQMWVNSVRAINYTMMRDAVDPPSYTFPVGSKAGYVFDPAVVTDSDENGFGPGNATIPAQFTGDDPNVDPDFEFESYSVSRMKFFEDLNKYASRPLEALRVPEILDDPSRLEGLDSLVLADNDMPEGSDRAAWVAALRAFVEGGGNLIVTDAAAPVIADLVDTIEPSHITMQKSNVGFVDFPDDRSHPLNAGLRGVASQTYDVIPIGLPDGGGAAPNWRVNSAAWTEAGGTTTGTMGGQTAYGEVPVGKGRIRFLGALLPQPSEQFFHPYGLQNYAVTYTGYTLLQNMLAWGRPDPEPTPTETVSPSPTDSASPTPTDTVSPSPTDTVSPTPTETASPTPTTTVTSPPPGNGGGGSTPTPDETESEPPVETGVMRTTIATDRPVVGYRQPFTISGVVDAPSFCGPTQVELSRRTYGQTRLEKIAAVDTEADGSWTHTGRGRVNASYIAAPKETGTCESAASAPTEVQVRAKIRAVAPRSCRAAVKGSVLPASPGSRIALHERRNGDWARVASERLGRSSRFSLVPSSCGRFKLSWKGSELNLPATKVLRIGR